jgi:hypothetical protein
LLFHPGGVRDLPPLLFHPGGVRDLLLMAEPSCMLGLHALALSPSPVDATVMHMNHDPNTAAHEGKNEERA